MNINYYILHYNRPYFAEAHLELAKLYFPFVNKFVLIDDGSDQEAFNVLKEKFDVCFRNESNKNEWKTGSASSLISNAFNSLESQICMFSEDDFLPCPLYFEDSIAEKTFLPPDVIFPKENKFCKEIINGIDIAFRKRAIFSLAKSNYGWKKYKKVKKIESVLEVDICDLKRVYSNWPWAMPSDMASSIFKFKKDLSIWQLEKAVDENLKSYIKNPRLFAPKVKNHLHAGFMCSTRQQSFDGIGNFNATRKKAIKDFLNNKDQIVNLDLQRKDLCEKYIDGKRINIEILFSHGLYKCLSDFQST